MPSCGVRPSVRLSVTFVDHVKTNKHVIEIFSPSGSHTILVFPHQTGCRYSDGNPPNRGVKCRWGRQKTRFWTNIWLYCTFVYWCLHIYRIMLIGVFLGHFRINLHQTRTQYSNEEPQHWNGAQFRYQVGYRRVGTILPHTKTNGQWPPKYVQITVDSNSCASAM